MIFINRGACSFAAFVSIAFALLLASAPFLHAQVLLIVDESKPAMVTITATGNVPSASYTTNYYDGFDLLGFFTSDASQIPNTTISSTLTTGDGSAGPIFDTTYADDESTGPGIPYYDLNLYGNADGGATESFTPDPDGSRAFKGSITFDTTGYTLAGTGGSVFAGSSYDAGTDNPGTIIGTYEIETPEPSTWAMLLGGLACLAGIRRRRRLTA